MKNKWLNRIGNLFLILSILFIFITIKNQNINFRSYLNDRKSIFIYLVIILIYVISLYINSEVYYKILSIFSKQRIKRQELQEVYITSNLAKYLPGNIMQYVGRNILGSKYGISQANMFLATILELILLLTVSGVMILLFSYNYIILVINLVLTTSWKVCLIIILIIFVIFILIFIKAFKNREKILFRAKNIDLNRVKGIIIKCIPLNFIVQLSTSITYLMVIYIITDISNLQLVNIIGIYLIAWLVGFIVPGAPGGVGIKEYILIVLLNNIIPKDVILVSVVLHRCLNIFAELIAFVFMKLIKRRGSVY